MNFIRMLNFWQLTVIGLVPIAILALYFLKLKRQPLEVPSTYLWRRTIEDLHVNSIWQRLRQSLLLFLQLLLVGLLILATFRPGREGAQLVGNRFIFLVDTSASMSATDVPPTRLEAAKKHIADLIDRMQADDVALIISFSNVARVEQSFTSNRSLLRQKVKDIKATQRTSDLREALRAAAGLANPGRTSDADNANDVQVAEALPATLYLYTDGGFSAVPDFSLGNLTPQYVPLGVAAPQNVGIVAFTAERNPEKADQWQAFARLENSGDAAVSLEVALTRDGGLADAQAVEIPAHGKVGVEFELPEIERATLQLALDRQDHLAADNRAYAAVDPGRRARVLLVTPGNAAFQFALDTEERAQTYRIQFWPSNVFPHGWAFHRPKLNSVRLSPGRRTGRILATADGGPGAPGPPSRRPGLDETSILRRKSRPTPGRTSRRPAGRLPDFDAVRDAQPVQFHIGFGQMGRDPRALLRPAGLRTGRNHAGKIGVKRDLELAAVQPAPQSARDVQPVQFQDRPRIGAEPG
jgi:hypothetical protein